MRGIFVKIRSKNLFLNTERQTKHVLVYLTGCILTIKLSKQS